MTDPQKILVVGPSWVGDMVMAQSLFRLLKFQHPDALIDVLAPKWSHPVLAVMPEIRKTWVSPCRHGELGLFKRFRRGKTLRKERYTQAIVLANSFKSALIPFFAKIKKRTGWVGECRYGLLNDIRHLDRKQYPFTYQHYYALGLPKDKLLTSDERIFWPALVLDKVQQTKFLEQYALSGKQKNILGVCPGAAFGASKRWPAECFAEVIRQKQREGWEVWLFGSPKDQPVGEAIKCQLQQPCVDLMDTPLIDSIYLMAQASLVLTNDSGTMHLAAALKRPLVALYGSTSPKINPPISEASVILWEALACSPCNKRECPLDHHRCMRDILPSVVLRKMDELMTFSRHC